MGSHRHEPSQLVPHGKPTEKLPRSSVAKRARMMGASSTRTFQRFERVLRKDMDLAVAISRGECKIGWAESIVSIPSRHRRFRKWLKAQRAARNTETA